MLLSILGADGFMTASFVEMLFPIAVLQGADDNTSRCGGVDKHVVLEIDAYMGHLAVAVGEEDDVAFAQLLAAY